MDRTGRRLAATLLLALGASACGGGETRPSEIEPTGPPVVRAEVVARHAAQFDEELTEREAGSQEEQAASQYILGHLQQAGYFVQLDAVPVANLVESTNLLALPPSGKEPETIVTVAYDADDRTAPYGATIGVFLELARALYVAERDHRIEFAALGAEATDEHLGSRRLAQQLREEDRNVDVITLVPNRDHVEVRGSLAGDVTAAADSVGIDARPLPGDELDVFARAGFDSALLGGPPEDLGATLLSYLQDDGG